MQADAAAARRGAIAGKHGYKACTTLVLREVRCERYGLLAIRQKRRSFVEADMAVQRDELSIPAWRWQFDTALRLVKSLTEGSMRIAESQLAAAAEMHASAEATRELLEKASDAQEQWHIQSAWISATLASSFVYWRNFYEATIQAQSSVARCLSSQIQLLGPQVPAAPEGRRARCWI